jgi:mono/diheme cytochrome c family protein
MFSPSISTRFDLKTPRLIIAVCSLTLSFALTAVSAQTPPSDAALTANAVYQKNCAKCHGKTAEGRHFGGPSLISDKTVATSADDLRNVINNGKGRMPKYASKLAPEEVDKLVEQIKAQQIKALNKE